MVLSVSGEGVQTGRFQETALGVIPIPVTSPKRVEDEEISLAVDQITDWAYSIKRRL